MLDYEKLYLENEKLVYKFAIENGIIHDEDMIQNLKMACYRAILKFDASKGFAISTFIYTSLYNEYNYSFRDKYRKFTFVNNQVLDKDNKSTDIFNFIEDVKHKDIIEELNKEEMLKVVYEYLDTLEPNFKNLYIDYYLNDKKQRQLAEEYNLSQGQISRRIKYINKSLQEILKDYK